jgi:hypothetical protein
MKTYWIMGPNPYKREGSIYAIIWTNVRRAQERVNRPLTKQELTNLIKLMKEKKFFESKQNSEGVFTSFIQQMKGCKLLSEVKPEETQNK